MQIIIQNYNITVKFRSTAESLEVFGVYYICRMIVKTFSATKMKGVLPELRLTFGRKSLPFLFVMWL